MSEVKERIIGAVTIMNEDDAAKIWQLIQSAFALANAPLAEPDEDEIEILNAYHNGNPEYQPAITHEELMNQLGL